MGTTSSKVLGVNVLDDIYTFNTNNDLDIFDIMFYSSEEERELARCEYYKMTEEQQNVFEMTVSLYFKPQ